MEVVKQAYVSRDLPIPDHITAHEVRALSASWAYTSHIALEDVLSACSWRSAGVFQNNYLRDMSLFADDLYSLGPLVVAQHLTGPRS